MSVYVFDDIKYDIDETRDYMIHNLQMSLGKKESAPFHSGGATIGYCDKGLYKIDISGNFGHSIEKYNYSNLIIMKIKETYIDSSGTEHVYNKLINIGAYIKENKKVQVKHLSDMFCGELKKIEGILYNNSDFSITVNNLKFHKALSYSNAHITNDLSTKYYEYDDDYVVIETIDDSQGDMIEIVDGFWLNNIYKSGSADYWNTTSFFKFVFRRAENAQHSYIYREVVMSVFDDKGNFMCTTDAGGFQLTYYTEYLVFLYGYDKDIKDIDYYINGWWAQNEYNIRVVFMNNLGIKYNGTGEKPYSRKFINDVGTYNHHYLTECTNYRTEEIKAEKYKYKNGSGLITFDFIDFDKGTRIGRCYGSLHPFEHTEAPGLSPTAMPVKGSKFLYWFSWEETWSNSNTDEVFSAVEGTTLIIYTTADALNSYGGDKEIYEKLCLNKLIEMEEITDALEVTYPDGNL